MISRQPLQNRIKTDVRRILMISFPSPTSYLRASSPLSNMAFLSEIISTERRDMVSDMPMSLLTRSAGKTRRKETMRDSGRNPESHSIAKFNRIVDSARVGLTAAWMTVSLRVHYQGEPRECAKTHKNSLIDSP